MTHPIDAYVGKRIRHRRWMLGLSQDKLGQKVGTKFQQIQKYEAGTNRVSASKLWELAQALDVSVEFFYDGISTDAAETDTNGDPLVDKEAAELVRYYYSIPNNQRKQLFELARVLGSAA